MGSEEEHRDVRDEDQGGGGKRVAHAAALFGPLEDEEDADAGEPSAAGVAARARASAARKRAALHPSSRNGEPATASAELDAEGQRPELEPENDDAWAIFQFVWRRKQWLVGGFGGIYGVRLEAVESAIRMRGIPPERHWEVAEQVNDWIEHALASVARKGRDGGKG